MAETELSVDQYLESRDARERWLAILEPIPGEEALVSVTPASSAGGCLRVAVRVPRCAISSVRPTGQRSHQGGRIVELVELCFAANAAIPLRELFAQLNEQVSAPAPGLLGQPLA